MGVKKNTKSNRRPRWRKLLWVWSFVGIVSPIIWLGWKVLGPRSPIVISYDTTRINGPLTEDGYVDYTAYVANSYPYVVEHIAEEPSDHIQAFTVLRAAIKAQNGAPKIIDSESDYDTFWAAIEWPEGRQKVVPFSSFDAPLAAVTIAQNRDWYHKLEEESRNPLNIAISEFQTERQATLSFEYDSKWWSRGYFRRRIMHRLGDGDFSEAWRDIDYLRRLSTRLLAAPIGHLPAYSLIELDQPACECAMIAILHAPVLSQDVTTWVEALPTHLSPRIQRQCLDERFRFQMLDYVQFLHRQPRVELDSFKYTLGFIDARYSETKIDWNGVLAEVNLLIDEIRDHYSARDSYGPQMEHFVSLCDKYLSEDDELYVELWNVIHQYYRVHTWSSCILSGHYRMVHLVHALSKWQRAHNEFPPSLKPIEVDAGARVRLALIDPFSGNMFRYEKTTRGFRLYSVGPNQKDDFGIRTIDDVLPAFRNDLGQDLRTGRSPDDIVFEWPPVSRSTID